jgi:hypothetical protein
MQALLIFEVALMVLWATKVTIQNIEQELRRKPLRYDDAV